MLDAFAPTVPGFFLYYPSRARVSAAFRSFVDVVKEVLGARGPVTPATGLRGAK